jgi:hypothetical protein
MSDSEEYMGEAVPQNMKKRCGRPRKDGSVTMQPAEVANAACAVPAGHQLVQFLNNSFLLKEDCLENARRSFRIHKSRCHPGRPVNLYFRAELRRTLLDKFKSEEAAIKKSIIRSVATELAKQHPHSLDQRLQRLRFSHRWCEVIQRELASGEPLTYPAAARRIMEPGLVSFSLEDLCSTCTSKMCANAQARFSDLELSLGLLLVVKKLKLL